MDTSLKIVKELLVSGNPDEAKSLFGKLPKEDKFLYIGQAIENDRFGDAVALIADYERQTNQLALFYDPVISALKVELMLVQKDLADRQAEHTDLVKLIDNFQVKYQNRVGDNLGKVLRLRKEKLAILAQMDASFQAQYEAAEARFNEFMEAYDSPIAGILYNISQEEEIELKRLYRKASLLCHPDRVAEKDKERAREMFEELNEAYEQNNIRKLRLMTELLQSVGYFESMRDNLTTSEGLRSQIELDRIDIEETDIDIEKVLASTAYQTVESIGDDWETYFKEMNLNFKAQCESLEKWLFVQGNQN